MKKLSLKFPRRGLIEATAFEDQPPESSPSLQNVMAFDPRTGRNRGGSRSGLTRYCPEQVSGSASVQSINHVSNAVSQAYLLLESGEQVLLEDGTPVLLEENSAGNVGDRETFLVAVAGGTSKRISTAGTDDITQGTATRTITSASADNPIVVTTTVAHGFATGSSVTISGVSSNATANGTFTITSTGTYTFTVPAAGAGTGAGGTAVGSVGRLSSVRNAIFSTEFFGDLLYCDSYVYRMYDTSANTMTSWTPTAGALPTDTVDGNTRVAYLIVRWGDRVVLAGLQTDGETFFMSAAGDALDWDYAATFSVEMAVAVANGDLVTALIPYTDDILLVGGDHTINRLRGNPAEDGRIDLVSDITGIAVGRAWCKSPEGIVYFFGSRGGVYKLEPVGGIPSRLTALSIDERLANIHMTDNQVTLEWDDRHLGVRVIITPRPSEGVVQESVMQYFWDVRNEAWFTIKHFNKNHNALAAHLFDGPDPDDRAVLIGTQDGWILKFDPDAHNDDGSVIESYVFLGPLNNLTVNEVQARLGAVSGNLRWSIHTTDDLETSLDGEPEAFGDLVAGRNASQWPKRYIDTGYIRLSSSESWSLERLELGVEKDSEQRARIF